jgi:hypothetical protein
MPSLSSRLRSRLWPTLVISPVVWATAFPAWAAAPRCEVQSGLQRTPVIELFTSEGCSSCPPADQWLSSLKGMPVVAQAFHVGYWDYIGWVDRFATPANAERQRMLASANHLSGSYTPQLVRDGRDWPQWRGTRAQQAAQATGELAHVAITLQQADGADQFSARVTPGEGVAQWSAYWTVTEHGYNSHVKAGENRGEFLQHDFVVRQYTPVGHYQGAQTLDFVAIAATAAHPRQINLVVQDPNTGAPLQAVSLHCGG